MAGSTGSATGHVGLKKRDAAFLLSCPNKRISANVFWGTRNSNSEEKGTKANRDRDNMNCKFSLDRARKLIFICDLMKVPFGKPRQ
jgi:hypothetical protein